MNYARAGLTGWMDDRRRQYNRWADRHTWLLGIIVAVLLASLIVVIAARLAPQEVPAPDVSNGPQTGQGRLP
jgi:hypothetical protein